MCSHSQQRYSHVEQARNWGGVCETFAYSNSDLHLTFLIRLTTT